jgi:hypothetical protein
MSLSGPLRGIHERRPLEEGAIGDRRVDPWQVLENGSPGTEIQVAYLGVAHLSRRQPDRSLGRAQDGVRPRRQQAAPDRHPGRGDRVGGGIPADPEAIEDDEHDRPWPSRSFDRHDAAICDSLARAVTAARATIPAISSGLSDAPPTSAPSIPGSAKNSPMLADVTLPP